jgi:hypothetical protein
MRDGITEFHYSHETADKKHLYLFKPELSPMVFPVLAELSGYKNEGSNRLVKGDTVVTFTGDFVVTSDDPAVVVADMNAAIKMMFDLYEPLPMKAGIESSSSLPPAPASQSPKPSPPPAVNVPITEEGLAAALKRRSISLEPPNPKAKRVDRFEEGKKLMAAGNYFSIRSRESDLIDLEYSAGLYPMQLLFAPYTSTRKAYTVQLYHDCPDFTKARKGQVPRRDRGLICKHIVLLTLSCNSISGFPEGYADMLKQSFVFDTIRFSKSRLKSVKGLALPEALVDVKPDESIHDDDATKGKIMDYMTEHPTEAVTVEELAKIIGQSVDETKRIVEIMKNERNLWQHDDGRIYTKIVFRFE